MDDKFVTFPPSKVRERRGLNQKLNFLTLTNHNQFVYGPFVVPVESHKIICQSTAH